MKRIHAISLAGYIIIIALVFGPALFPQQGFLIFGDDIHRYYYFYWKFFNIFFHKGIFPWWNPYNFSGSPFLANPQVNIWYPPTWLLVFLPLNIAYPWHLALHIFWAMLGMRFFLQRTVFSSHSDRLNYSWLDQFSAWIGGLLFGLSGFFMARTWAGHVDITAAASWMPWVIGCMSILMSTKIRWKNYLVIASLTVALQIYAGYQTMAFFTLEAVGLIAMFDSLRAKSFVPFVRVGLAIAFGFGLAALQLLPHQEFVRNSIRTYILPYSWNSYGSLAWESLRQLLNPFRFGNQYTYAGPPPNFIEHSFFVGRIGLLLISIALFFIIGKIFFIHKHLNRVVDNRAFRWGWISILLVLLGLWVSLGPNAGIDLQKILWRFIPMYHYLRIPPRHLIVVVFGLSVLATIGLSQIKHKLLYLIIVLCVVIEMVFFARSFIEVKLGPETRHDPELIQLFTKDLQPYRLLQNFGVWLPQREVLDPDSTMSYGIFSATGYDPSIIRNYYEFVSKASGQEGSDAMRTTDVQVPYLSSLSGNALDQLNIKYLMVPIQYDPFVANPRYKLLRENTKDSYRVYENTTVFPRFYFKNSPCGSASVSSFTPNRVEVVTNAVCDTALLSSEVWYPGWHAKVDGKSVSIDKLNDTFRTIIVPLGKHTVVFEYRPVIFYFAGAVSVLTLMLLLIIVFMKRKP